MPSLDSGEPFGLPKGTVRGIIALAFTAVTLEQFVVAGAVDVALLGITTLIVGNYFGSRGAEPAATPTSDDEDEILPPAVAGDGSD